MYYLNYMCHCSVCYCFNRILLQLFIGKTRQLHSAHLTTYDRLWSCFPYLRPMATMIRDSLQYGIDEDGASVHDVIGNYG